MCSDNNTAVLTDKGDLYVFGSFLYHIAPQQLENSFIPIQPNNIKVEFIALGDNHMLLVSNNKELYSAGRNAEGQLGLGYIVDFVDIAASKPIEFFKSSEVSKCYAAQNYSIVLTAGESSRLWIFGDIGFLQGGNQSNKQLIPQEMKWGEIEKVACAPDHMLLLRKEPNNLYTLLSVGNGMYGKLGNNDPNGGNHYSPIKVELPYYEIKSIEQVKIRCGKYTSGILMRGTENSKNKLYLWGLCHQKLFLNIKEAQREHTFGEYPPIENTITVICPTLITTYNVYDFDIGEGIIYFINSKNQLEKIGDFRLNKRKKDSSVDEQFSQIALGLNHAAAVSKKGILFTWGSSIMNKLGYNNNSNRIKLEDLDADDENFFEDAPHNVVKFNEMFEEQNKKEDPNDMIDKIKEITARDLKATPLNEDLEESEEQNETEKEEESEEENESSVNAFAKAKEAVKYSTPKFEDFEKKLKNSETNLQEKMKETLEKYKFLTKNSKLAASRFKSAQNMFYFKFGDSPISTQFKSSSLNWKKYPPKFMTFRKNINALLSVFHTHPCYFLNIYKHQLMSPKELYGMIKEIFSLNRQDKFSKLILVRLCKEILKIDLETLKASHETNQETTHVNYLKDYKLKEGKPGELTLFGRLCKFVFKLDQDFLNQQSIASIYIVANIFSSLKNWRECEEDLYIKNYPVNGTAERVELNNFKRSTRIDLILKQFDYFANDLLRKPSLEKNNLFSPNNQHNKGDNEVLFVLPEICNLLIQEIVNTLKTVSNDTEEIKNWMAKHFAQILFCRLIKILKDPEKLLAANASFQRDIPLYRTFMSKCKNNFYSVADTFEYCLAYLAFSDENLQAEDEIYKQIENSFQSIKSSVVVSIKNLLFKSYDKTYSPGNADEDEGQDKQSCVKEFDFLFLEEFFHHSQQDSLYIVNFSLLKLKKLFEVIKGSRDKLRVIDKEFDVLEQILKHNNFVDNLDMLDSINANNDKYCQFKLKTKSLALKSPNSLMKCRSCNALLMNEHIQGNESLYFNRFDFINKSSGKGKLIEILKTLDISELNTDTFTNFLSKQLEKKKDNLVFRENVYQLLTLIALEYKDDLCIGEETIKDQEKLFEEMLCQKFGQNFVNAKLKSYAEDIKQNYDSMTWQIKYYTELYSVLDTIKERASQFQSSEEKHSLCDVYKEVQKAILVGYGNNEIKKINKSISFNSVFQKLIRHNDSLPKSETIHKNLPNTMKKKMEAVREFKMQSLVEKRVIIKVLKYKNELSSDIQSFLLAINRTSDFEFVCSLLKKQKSKQSFFVCGKSEEGSSEAQKILTFKIDCDKLWELIKASTKKSSQANGIVLGDFIQVRPKDFMDILRKLFNIGFYAPED